MRIGIPRALLYYWYGFYWENFWKTSGLTVITSPATNQQLMSAGIEVGLDELCLPVKIFLGHIRILAHQVDYIMIPHLIKVESDAYICPKFMGLPDIVSHAVPNVKDKMVVVKVGPEQVDMSVSLKKAAKQLGIKSNFRKFSNKPDLTINPAVEMLNNYNKEETLAKNDNRLNIGLLGHPYCLYDSCFNLNLLKALNLNGVKFLTPEMLPDNYRGIGSNKLAKKLFWTTGKLQFDALDWMLNSAEEVDGFIQIAPFACGPEAIVGDMLERRIKAANKPYLKIFYEEHSGEAGIITRLEAFIDLIKYRRLAC